MSGHPYAKRDKPRKTRVIPAEGKKWTGWPENGLDFWRLLSKMLNEEPVHERDRMMLAMLKPLGIEKGKKFEPDATAEEDPGAGRGGRRVDGSRPELRQAAEGSQDVPRRPLEKRGALGGRPGDEAPHRTR